MLFLKDLTNLSWFSCDRIHGATKASPITRKKGEFCVFPFQKGVLVSKQMIPLKTLKFGRVSHCRFWNNLFQFPTDIKSRLL